MASMAASPKSKRRRLSNELSLDISGDYLEEAALAQNSVDSLQNIRVVTRVRPLSSKEILEKSKETIVAFESSSTIAVVNDRKFEFDHVFSPLASQSEVYEKSVEDLVRNHLFHGFNVTVLAYGQTGSGKTHTMLGSFGREPSSEDGITARAVRDVFSWIDKSGPGTQVSVEMSYLEIYNEDVRDLLCCESTTSASEFIESTVRRHKPVSVMSSDNISSDSTFRQDDFSVSTATSSLLSRRMNSFDSTLRQGKKELILRDTKDGVTVQNLTWKNVESADVVSELMTLAAQRRATGSTAMNSESSRSHAICTLIIRLKSESEAEEIRSKLTLVDLAGSERIKRTGAEGTRMKEGININKGLFVLGQVVSALSEMSQQQGVNGNSSVQSSAHSHIKYRDSKLTRLLQDSLGGNSKTVMLACVSPADTNIEESLNTLRYAFRARSIKNAAIRNVVETILSPSEAAALREENQRLKLQIMQLQKSKVPSPSKLSSFPYTLAHMGYTESDNGNNGVLGMNFLDLDNSKENDESFDSKQSMSEAQENLKSELFAMSGTIEEKEQMMRKIVLDRDHMESVRLQVQATIGALQHEVDVLSKERDELIAKSNAGKSRSLPASKVNDRVVQLENQIKNLKEKLADHSKVLRQREEAEKKCAQLSAEIMEDKKKRASMQRRLKEISDERRAEKKVAAMNAAKMLRDSQRLKCELAKVKEAAARQEAVFKRKAAEAVLKRSRKTSSGLSTAPVTSSERKDELISWIDKEISSSCYLNNLQSQIVHQTKLFQDLLDRKAQISDPASNQSRSLDVELQMTSDMIHQLERNIEEVLSICSSKPIDSTIPFLDEMVWNTLSLSDLRFVAVTFFERYLSLEKKKEKIIDIEPTNQNSEETSDESESLQHTVDNLLKSFVVSKSMKKDEESASACTTTEKRTIHDQGNEKKRKANESSKQVIPDFEEIVVDDVDIDDDKDDSDWSPTNTPPLSRHSRPSKKSSSLDSSRSNNVLSSSGPASFKLESMTKVELQAELRARGLTVSGTKSELQSRLASASNKFSSSGKAHDIFSASLRSSESNVQTDHVRPDTRSKRPPLPSSRGRPSSTFNATEMKTALIVFDDDFDGIHLQSSSDSVVPSLRAQSSQSSHRRSMRLSNSFKNEKENRPHTSNTANRRSVLYSNGHEISLSDSAKKKRRRSMTDSVHKALMQLDLDGNLL